MTLPPQSKPVERSFTAQAYLGEVGVTPQARLCTPCVRIGGRWCVRLLGKRWCVNLPYFGRWKACCWTRWGWPPVKCGVKQC